MMKSKLGLCHLVVLIFTNHICSSTPAVADIAGLLGGPELSGFYLKNLSRHQLLTAEEEIVLSRMVRRFKKLREEQKTRKLSPEERKQLHSARIARERFIHANLRLVLNISKKYQNFGLEFADLVQEGSIGLTTAVEKFDPTRGYRFSTYAFLWIKQSINRAIADKARTVRIPLHHHEKRAKVAKASRDYLAENARLPSKEVLANLTGSSQEDLDLINQIFRGTLSLDSPLGIDNDEKTSRLMDTISGGNEPELETLQNQLVWDTILPHLSTEELDIIRGLYFEGQSLGQIGKEQGVTGERIRQKRNRAFAKIRTVLAQADIGPS